MRRTSAAIFVFLTVVALAMGKDKYQETIEQLKARAEQAKPRDQVKLFMQVAEREVVDADQLYNAGDFQRAQSLVEDAALSAEKAGEAAMNTNKDVKRTEIAVRKLSTRLQDIWHSLAVEDRPPVKTAADRLEKLDGNLLDHMFKRKK